MLTFLFSFYNIYFILLLLKRLLVIINIIIIILFLNLKDADGTLI